VKSAKASLMTKPSVLWPGIPTFGAGLKAQRCLHHDRGCFAASKLYLDDNGSNVLNEVKEIIHLQSSGAKSASNQDNESIDLGGLGAT
jgi:hypothetical protein